MQRGLVVTDGRFGPTYRSHLQGLSGLAQNVGNYRYTMCKIPEKRRFHLQHGWKTFMFLLVHQTQLPN